MSNIGMNTFRTKRLMGNAVLVVSVWCHQRCARGTGAQCHSTSGNDRATECNIPDTDCRGQAVIELKAQRRRIGSGGG